MQQIFKILVILSVSVHGAERCRICFEESEDTSKFIKPCDCSGSMQYVHLGCLTDSLRVNRNTTCGVCLQVYRGIQIKKLKPSFWSFLAYDPTLIFFSAFLLLIVAMISDYGIRVLKDLKDRYVTSQTTKAKVGAASLIVLFLLMWYGSFVFLIIVSSMAFDVFFHDYRIFCLRYPKITIVHNPIPQTALTSNSGMSTALITVT